jgi:hypothetical protein
VYHWKVGVQVLAQSVSLEGLCTVSCSVYQRKVCVQFLDQSVSLESLRTLSSSEGVVIHSELGTVHKPSGDTL